MSPEEVATFSIDVRTPNDAQRAFRAHTTFVTGRCKMTGQVFAFEKCAAGDRKAVAGCVLNVLSQADSALRASRPGVDGAGI